MNRDCLQSNENIQSPHPHLNHPDLVKSQEVSRYTTGQSQVDWSSASLNVGLMTEMLDSFTVQYFK